MYRRGVIDLLIVFAMATLLAAALIGCAGPCGWACGRLSQYVCLRSVRWDGENRCRCGISTSVVGPVERIDVELVLKGDCDYIVRGRKGCY